MSTMTQEEYTACEFLADSLSPVVSDGGQFVEQISREMKEVQCYKGLPAGQLTAEHVARFDAGMQRLADALENLRALGQELHQAAGVVREEG